MILGKIDGNEFFGAKLYYDFRLLDGEHVPILKKAVAIITKEGIALETWYLVFCEKFQHEKSTRGRKAKRILELNKSQPEDLEKEMERIKKDKEDSLRLAPPTALP